MGGLTPIRMTRGEALPQPADAGSDTPGVPGGSYRDRLGAVGGTRGTVLHLVARFPNVEILHPRLFRARDLGRGLGGRTRMRVACERRGGLDLFDSPTEKGNAPRRETGTAQYQCRPFVDIEVVASRHLEICDEMTRQC